MRPTWPPTPPRASTFRPRRLRPTLAVCVVILAALLTAGRSLSDARAAASCDVPSFKAQTRFPVGKNPRALVVTDLNADGLSDVVVANKGTNDGDNEGSVLVLLGDAGTLFKTGVSLKPGLNPRNLFAGDFNRDGKQDVAVLIWPPNCCLQAAVTVLLGDGTGNLTATGVLTLVGGSNVNGNPSPLAGGDFNGDGNTDVVVFGNGSPTSGAYVLSGNGTGGFAAPAFLPTGGIDGQLATGDFNGDGRLDLAVAGGVGYSVFPGDGQGGFGPATTTSFNFFVTSIVAGDFNLDGKLDLVTANGNTVLLLSGDGTGKFNAGPNIFVLDLAYRAHTGDFNGDGKLDVAVTTWSSAVSILLGDGAGGFAPARHFGTGPGPVYFAVGDFDRDGQADLLTSDASTDDLALLRGEGTGDFKTAGVFTAGVTPIHAAGGDFNRDGRPDLAVVNANQNHVSILLGEDNGKFRAGGQVNVLSPIFVAVADFNRDGRQDLAVSIGSPFFSTVSVALGDGAGGFGTPTPFTAGTNSHAIAAADFDNDGKTDMAVVGMDSGDISLLLGDGAGGFAPALKTVVGGFPFSLMTADFNHDCHADLVVLGDNNRASLLLGDGTGKFAQPVALSPPGNPRSVAAGDLDGDGNLDLILPGGFDPFGDTTKGWATLYLGNGAGGFGAPTSVGVGPRRELATPADFNGDGKLDIALLNNSGSVSILLNAGGGTFPTATNFPHVAGTSFMLAGDFSGDGSPDLVTRGGGDNVAVLYNSCPGAASAAQTPSVQFGAPCVGVLEGEGVVQVGVTRTGNLDGELAVDYFTSNGTASDINDYATAIGRLRFSPNETSRVLRIIITDDAYVETPEQFQVSLANPTGGALGSPASARIIIKDTDTAGAPNPITPEANNSAFFVRQHYADFLSREPDAPGLAFWTGEIESCGNNASCREVKRLNASAAFFLSIEFQQTGYLVYRTYKAAYGDTTSPNVEGTVPIVRLQEFLPDTRIIGDDVVVNSDGWEQRLEANKQAYMLEFVRRQRFTDAFPMSMTAAQFVDELNQNAGGVLTQAERGDLVSQLSSDPDSAPARAAVLRAVAENAALQQNELRRAFVLMQYYGYLRRNPDDPQDADFRGWKFWLDKLNEFDGNYIEAEMVKAFIQSDEYRKRFGQ